MLHTLPSDEAIRLESVSKTFVLHLQDGARLPAVTRLSFSVRPGECVALHGSSGAGKSSVLKMIFGNYLTDEGLILVRSGDRVVNVATAEARDVVALRRQTIGYVSQFLRVIPRVPCLDIVAAAAREDGCEDTQALARAQDLLARLNLPERLWGLPPATFSGGEQQRVNIARGFAAYRPIMLLDEPTASLDAANSEAVIALIGERKAAGAAIVGVFHDPAIRNRVADRLIAVSRPERSEAA